MKILGRALELYYRFTAFVCCVILAVVTLVLIWEILSRFFFGQSLRFVAPLVGYSLFVITFLSAAWVLRRSGHISVDIVVDALRGRWQLGLRMVLDLVAAALTGFLAYLTAVYAFTAWQQGTTTPYPFQVPRGLLLSVMPIGLGFLALEFVIQFSRKAGRFRTETGTGASSEEPAI
ncbi:TRAP transporter small permease [Nitriliruptor alkaliphilus]|uniref:TRAP transporter small permease n=1 Tax=Nitriliruptor alkaliphilus TaxID=427918 RepID=UPI0006983D10|nr:TRAP transporter small permease subunit [Nitriliruptor alkaliphilus]